LCAFVTEPLIAQKFLVLDRFGKSRIRLAEGDLVAFKQKGNKVMYRDVIRELGDSTVMFGSQVQPFKLSEFDSFHFRRTGITFVRGGTTFIGSGFLFAALVEPLIGDSRYDRRESAIIGATFLGGSQLLRLFEKKTFRVNDRSRVRIIDTTVIDHREVPPPDED
jgi:hypothetical protein